MLKSLYACVLCFAFALTSCTTRSVAQSEFPKTEPSVSIASYTASTKLHVKSPIEVAVYHKKSAISHPYRIIGKEEVSRYNFIGLERQSATVDELMRKIAASMGGDAVINITRDNQKVEGTVISYEKVLL